MSLYIQKDENNNAPQIDFKDLFGDSKDYLYLCTHKNENLPSLSMMLKCVGQYI